MTGYTSLLLKTGQITKYVNGDDGDLEFGVAKSYTVLDTGQYSGTTNITLHGHTETKSNNCVRDNVTGLTWSKNQSASLGYFDGKGYTGGLPWTTNGDGEGIFTYVAAANAASFAGNADWRIPNFTELASLVDYETGLFDAVAFDSYYGDIWCSTPGKEIAYAHYYPRLLSNGWTQALKTNGIINVLLVRGAPTAPPVGVNTLRSLLGAGY